MKKILLTIVFAISNYAISQTPGTLDSNFANNGVSMEHGGRYLFPYSISIQENSGNIFVGMQAGTSSTNESIAMIRKLDFYGNPVTSFGINGILKILFPQARLQRIFQIIPDNSSLGTQGFFLRGTYTDFSNNIIDYISKHNADGSLDLQFGNNGVLNIYGQITGNYIYSLTLNSFTGHQSFKRYNLIDGSLDTTFANTDLPSLDSQQHFISGQYNHINIQKDGKIVLVGYNNITENYKEPAVVRFNENGTIDNSFGNSGFFTSPYVLIMPQESVTQSDGKIVYTDGDANFVRLNSNGTLDNSYGNNGIFSLNGNSAERYLFAYNLTIQDDDKIYFNGELFPDWFNDSNTDVQYIARLNTNGSLDFVNKSFQSNYYSEIWSNTLVKDSFILTNGVYATSNTEWNNVVQRIYTKKPVLSIFGTSTNNIDMDLTTLDNSIFTAKVNLNAGTLKFRLDHKNSYNWGGTFPSGSSTMGKNDIIIPQNGEYDISFNLKNGEFSISNPLSTNENLASIIKVYPNPTHNELYFTKTVSEITVFDKSGKMILSQNKKTKFISLKNLSIGSYIISFKTEDGKILKKEVIKN